MLGWVTSLGSGPCIDRGFTLYSRRSVRRLVAAAIYDWNAAASKVRGQEEIVRVWRAAKIGGGFTKVKKRKWMERRFGSTKGSKSHSRLFISTPTDCTWRREIGP